jgi:heterodisulfide reductase subunit A
LHTLAEVNRLSGSEGNFTVELTQHPRYVDMNKCIACGLCAEKCPRKVIDEYNAGLSRRKAVYVPYSQAVPLKYAIDPQHCIYIEKGKCRACEKFCPSGAINLNDSERKVTVKVGSVILAPGFQSFDPMRFDQYAYASSPDVVTSLEFERILSATGPFGGELLRPSSQKSRSSSGGHPRKIAWLQCIGSRDINRCDNGYCSAVCCMYAVKQAIIAKDHSKTPLECAIFYMDMRTQGKDFDRYLEKARDMGVRFIPSRVHTVETPGEAQGLMLRYVEANGKPRAESFDMVVLSTGLEISASAIELAERLGVDLDANGFTAAGCLQPVATSVPGIYACGAFTGPKDIPNAVMEASAAACAASAALAPARSTRTRQVSIPPETDVSRQKPRVGVFVCNCGINIGGIVRVPEVAEYASGLPGVVYVEENLFTCSQDTQDKIAAVIAERKLNRVVIAACTPRTHENLFQETLTSAGLNKYLLEMANIRNHDSWVHSDDPDAATAKAKDLVRMAVAKACRLDALQETGLPVSRSALIVGGGLAGMTAALSLSRQGFPVDLVERSDRLGGNARRLNRTYQGEDVAAYIEQMIQALEAEARVRIHLNARVADVQGFVGNFATEINADGSTTSVAHGVTLLATGARESKPDAYLYGQHPAVMTHLELDALLRDNDPRLKAAHSIGFIQCVGSRNAQRPYCSKVCCTHTLQSALALRERNPEVAIYVLYRDMRAYGKREDLYRRAREQGIIFCRYTPEKPPSAQAFGEKVALTFNDPIIGRDLCVELDLLCLAAAIEADIDPALLQAFKVTCDADGWLLEAHQKLRPVECATDGVYLCGMAHYPKPMEETIAQAQAAASRALTVLARERIQVGGVVSRIAPELCSGCMGCIDVCPFSAISFNAEAQVAEVNQALCKGCGACAATCPSEAAVLMGFNNQQLYAQIKSALSA